MKFANLSRHCLVLIGAPNSGKTTLFNRLTGLQTKAVNYPGSTVDIFLGAFRFAKAEDSVAIQVIDTPGIYSLDPRSPDEAVTRKLIDEMRSRPDRPLILVVIDQTQIQRQLGLVQRLIERGERVAVGMTMMDLSVKDSRPLSLDHLALDLGVPVFDLTQRSRGEPIKTDFGRLEDWIRQESTKSPEAPRDLAPSNADSESLSDDWRRRRFLEASAVVERARAHGAKLAGQGTDEVLRLSARERTQSIDRVLLQPVLGPLIFIVFMAIVFSSVYGLAQPFMDGIDFALSWVKDQTLQSAPTSLALQFLTEGILSGFAAVLIFTPQIYILFLCINILEDSGYLARAAALVDRPLEWIGLGGRSFVPLLSGFACAVPAMIAARSIRSDRERWLTLFILPLMSCSARLPVYALLLGFLFPNQPLQAGLALTALYLGSILVGAVTSLFASRLLQKSEAWRAKTSFLMLELPLYRRPNLALALKTAWYRTLSYVQRAGLTILLLSIGIWCATQFPDFRNPDPQAKMANSYAGRLGRVLTPVFEPMGGDWRTGVSLISAFAAREVFVSTLAVLFSAPTDTDGNAEISEDTMQGRLQERMREATIANGQPLFTTASISALLIFFLIALQCLSTFGVAVRESGSWAFAWTQLLVFNGVAYVSAIFVFQLLERVLTKS